MSLPNTTTTPLSYRTQYNQPDKQLAIEGMRQHTCQACGQQGHRSPFHGDCPYVYEAWAGNLRVYNGDWVPGTYPDGKPKTIQREPC